ncbi:MAG TPA: tol-pal system protein YbgF [Deltaproteobacteria bacterium]|nr:tol-pal system protein YbgF [Deltaproteobacteria bacterium]HPR56369.1 tol-pal system protein YbgF [Deltaproteobacteria bacterium]HXK48697.1 tol-pal system protein YbgF [Deltaproteobacteria bacterium]
MKRIIIPIILLSLAGCATQRDLDTLRFQVVTLQSRLNMNESKLNEKEKVLDQSLKQQGELLNKYSELQNQLFSLQGSIDQLSASAGLTPGGGGETRIALLEKDVQTLKEMLQAKGPGAAGSQKSLYESAMEKYKAGLYAEALQDFKGYLGQNPDPGLAGEAYFFMGETLFSLNRFDDAILSYDTVVKKYKESGRVAEALYKEGMSFMKMGDRETGELIWQQLVKEHPDSEAAKKAKEGMKNPPVGKG